MSRDFTNWDSYKDRKDICSKLGCNKESQYYCCPDLDGTLCKPKQKLLKDLNVAERELDQNKYEIHLEGEWINAKTN